MCMLMNINMFPNKEIIFFWIFHIQIWTLPNLWLKFISKFGLYQIFGQIHVQIWILPNLWLKIFITSQNENFLKAKKKLVLYFYLNQKLFLFFFNCLMKILFNYLNVKTFLFNKEILFFIRTYWEWRVIFLKCIRDHKIIFFISVLEPEIFLFKRNFYYQSAGNNFF